MIFRQGRKISFISPLGANYHSAKPIIIWRSQLSFGRSPTAKIPNKSRRIRGGFYQLLGLLLASLVCNAARGLASGLAGGLALAASAVLNGSLEVTSIDSTNSLHCKIPPFGYNLIHHIVYMIFARLSRGFDDFWRNPRIFQHFEVIFYLLGDSFAGQKQGNAGGIDPNVGV